jgi:hypothetical protein
VAEVIGFFVELGTPLLDAVGRAGAGSAGPTMREVARSRHELYKLLSELVVEAVAPHLRSFQAEVVEQLGVATRPAARGGGEPGSIDDLLQEIVTKLGRPAARGSA